MNKENYNSRSKGHSKESSGKRNYVTEEDMKEQY